ncbi:MAG: helix-turn-helix transcriptional regulator [Pyrinomonadaceae bacterium]|nr:helix-turn-helix transcriptional regulator [Pyrinomonadaceae bacterium]
MGTARRPKPKHLAEKLLHIRLALNLSQNDLIKRLDFEKELVQGTISTYELGKREPSLPLLLRYARLAGVCVDILIDDELELPAKLPTTPTHKVPVRLFRVKRSR